MITRLSEQVATVLGGVRAAAVLAAAVLAAVTATAAAQPAPTFTSTPCPSDVQATECGYVDVPEDRSREDGATVRLFVAVVRSEEQDRAPDPVLFLAGGPGEMGARYAALSSLYGGRDLIAFDQRGAGRSEPALGCPEYTALLEAGGVGSELSEAGAARQVEVIVRCGERLRAQGIALEAYTTAESAADVDAIRRALGYEHVNLIGVSYGTRLAQEVMRRFPEGVRAAVLDSVIPPPIDRSADTPRSAAAALERIFAACEEDAVCRQAYPSLQESYTQLLTALDAQPPQVTLAGTTLELNGSMFQALAFASSYSPLGAAELPSLVHRLSVGNVAALQGSFAEQFAQAVVSTVSWGKFFATECRGEVAYSDPAALEATYRALPMWRGTLGLSPGISSRHIYRICEAWGLTEPSVGENDPLVSDVPALLLAGEFDPVTPPRYLELASKGLSNAFSYSFPGQSHAVGLANECALSVVHSFLMDPATAPDASCTADLTPAFYIGDREAP